MELNELKRGDRIEIHPATDWWMRGACYGEVITLGRKLVTVKLDKWSRPIKFNSGNILRVVSVALIAVLLLAGHAEARGSGGGHGHPRFTLEEVETCPSRSRETVRSCSVQETCAA
jgi:hypothetical protein